jgi:hypothetical protein
MAITIDIFITDQGVAARKNRDSEDPGQKVTWNFNYNPLPNNYHVVFKEFQSPGSGTKQPISVEGPFSQPLVTIGGQADGIISPNPQTGLYFYEIQDNSRVPLRWLNSVSTGLNFGGLDVPKGPP